MYKLRHGWNRNALPTVVCAMALAGVAPALAIAEEPAEHDHTHVAASSDTAMKSGDSASDMMQQMHEMHAKMVAARTPAERMALMHKQMELMQSGMTLMQGMKGPMSQRMDMMQMMMQMMMDRISAPDSEKPPTSN
jgi:hypothetical protein